jgi:2-methylcitrate dehydratase PrpD
MASIARELSRLVVQTAAADLPPLALERAKMSVASTVASAAMGAAIPSAHAMREVQRERGGASQATMWFSAAPGGEKADVAGAAQVNAAASDAAASDDSDLRSIAHIGTIVSVTSIAMAERMQKGGGEVLEAMVLGYEVAGRIDEALTPGRMQRGFHGSVSTIFGATVATGRLLKLDEERLAHAIALAASSACGMAIAADTSCAREYHAALAAQLGVQAAVAAERGFAAEIGVLEAPRGFFQAMGGQALEDVTRDWGASWDIVTDMAIKLMPGAHPFHAIAEAAIGAAVEGNIDPREVEQIVISAIQMRDWGSGKHPRDLVGGAHSVIYFVAAAVADRRFDWEHMTEAKFADPLIAALQEKVVFDPEPAPLPDRFTHRHGGTVSIRMKSGAVHAHTCKAPRGSGPRGVEWADVDAKYRRLVPRSGLAPAKVEASLAQIHALERCSNIGGLTALIATVA